MLWTRGVSAPADLHSAEVFSNRAAAEARARALWGTPEVEPNQPEAPAEAPPPRVTGSVQIVLESVWVAGGAEDPDVTDFPGRRERRGQAPGAPILAISDPEFEGEGAQVEVWELPVLD